MTKMIPAAGFWAPEFEGFFFSTDCEPAYYFDMLRFCRLDWSSEKPVVLHVSDKIELPSRWQLVTQHDGNFLVIGPGQAYDLQKKCMVPSAREDVFAAAAAQRPREKHFEDDDFLFGDYCISHKGSWGYVCHRSGQKVWEFQGKAYLYTEMNLLDDVLYFSTAGQGGYFYALRLSDGTQLLQVKTGDTAQIAQHGNCIYFLARDKRKTQLMRADLVNLTLEVVAELPGIPTTRSPVQVVDGELHCATVEEKNGQLMRVFWNRYPL